MTVETDGSVRFRGDSGPGIPVRVLADDGRLRLVSGKELVGDWLVRDLGINVLQDGFAIKIEGEQFLLRADEDALLAEELGIVAASPRMARKVAALHNPEPGLPETDAVAEPKSNVLAIAFALGGVLVLLGGTFLRIAPTTGASAQTVEDAADSGGAEFWLAFVLGGLLMVGVAYVMSIGTRWARTVSLLVMAVVVAVFAWVISNAVNDSSHLTAYGFIAGGLVVGVAVLFSGGLQNTE
jgi:hypothetical protein